MNWDAISAISDAIAATAVVVSLIYLLLEVRQNSKAVRSSTRSDISRGQMEINFVFAQNPELRRVSYGLLRGDELSDDERSSASHCLTAMFRTFENQYYAYHEGTFSESIWRGYRENVVWNTQQSNFLGFWADRAPLFGEEFVSFVDDLVNEHKRS